MPGLLLALTIRLDYLKGLRPFSCKGYYIFACAGALATCLVDNAAMVSILARFAACRASSGYAIGLAMADAAVIATKIGQPALLYLVPCTLGTTLAIAACRSELAWMWHGVN